MLTAKEISASVYQISITTAEASVVEIITEIISRSLELLRDACLTHIYGIKLGRMATLAPMASPRRQPFASLDGSRLRNLTNMKNKQNGISLSPQHQSNRSIIPSRAFH